MNFKDVAKTLGIGERDVLTLIAIGELWTSAPHTVEPNEIQRYLAAHPKRASS